MTDVSIPLQATVIQQLRGLLCVSAVPHPASARRHRWHHQPGSKIKNKESGVIPYFSHHASSHSGSRMQPVSFYKTSQTPQIAKMMPPLPILYKIAHSAMLYTSGVPIIAFQICVSFLSVCCEPTVHAGHAGGDPFKLFPGAATARRARRQAEPTSIGQTDGSKAKENSADIIPHAGSLAKMGSAPIPPAPTRPSTDASRILTSNR